jgi:hypothetical protein
MTNEKSKWIVGVGAVLSVLSGCAVDPDGGGGSAPPNDMDMNDVGMSPQPDAGEEPEVDGGDADPEGDAATVDSPDAGGGSTDDGGEDIPVIMDAWPGGAPTTADRSDTFGGNLSGLTFSAASAGVPEVLWAVQNNPAMLFRLEREQDGEWEPAGRGFRDGKQLLYPDGDGVPDAEGVTFADGAAIYVASERNNDQEDVSRSSILRYELSDSDSLTATHEWRLADLPEVDPNEGIESVTWVPDAYLTLHHFHDQTRDEAYDPANYLGHGSGLFFVGLEANGVIYAYALDHDGTRAQRVATIESGHPQVMGLEFDREQGALWAQCDDGCGNRTSVLAIAGQTGQFEMLAMFDPPEELSELNNEGIAFSDCREGERTFFWADDNETNGHAIRASVVPCAPFGP